MTLSSIGDAVIATDSAATITFMNSVAEKLTGWTFQEASGQKIDGVFHIINEQTRQQVESPIERVLKEGVIVGLANHTVLIAKDGQEIPIDDRGAPIRSIDGTLYGVVLTFRDIIERKQAEEELIESEQRLKNAQAIGKIGDWEYDTNTQEIKWSDQVFELYERDLSLGYPTAEEEAAYYSPEQAKILQDYARLAIEEGKTFEYDLEAKLPSGKTLQLAARMTSVRDKSGSVVKLVGTVQVVTNAQRAKDLVHRLHLSVRGMEEDKLTPISANEVIQEAEQSARPRWKDEAESKGITIEVVTHLEEVSWIRGTESRLHDILTNLLFNAVDAMPQGGTITIHTRMVDDHVRLTFSDTGMGMDEETCNRVFEPFFTTKMDIGT